MTPRMERLHQDDHPFARHPVLGGRRGAALALAEWRRLEARLTALAGRLDRGHALRVRSALKGQVQDLFSLLMETDMALARRCRPQARALEKISLDCSADALGCPRERLEALLGPDGPRLVQGSIPMEVDLEPRPAAPGAQAPLPAVMLRQLHNTLTQGLAIHHMTHAMILAEAELEALDPGLALQLALHAELAQMSQYWSPDPLPGMSLGAAGKSSVRWVPGPQGPEARLEARATLPHILVQEISKAALEAVFSVALPRPATPQAAWAADLIARADRLDHEPWTWIMGPELARRLAAKDALYQAQPPLQAARSFALLPLEAAELHCQAAVEDLALN